MIVCEIIEFFYCIELKYLVYMVIMLDGVVINGILVEEIEELIMLIENF